MTTVCEVGPSTIRLLDPGTTCPTPPDDTTAEGWRAVLEPLLAGAGDVLLVHPSWWTPGKVAMVTDAVRGAAATVRAVARAALLHPDQTFVEIGPEFVAIGDGHGITGAETRCAEVDVVIDRVVGRLADGLVHIDAPTGVPGADALGARLARRLRVHPARCVLVEDTLAQVTSALQTERNAPRLEFFYDLACPYSYLAATQLAQLAARTGANLHFRPMVLGRVQAEEHESAGDSEPRRPSPRLSAARLRYLQTDLTRWARRLRVPFHFPSRYPTNTIQALRLCVQAQERSEALHQALALRLFRAYWAQDEDLLDQQVLARALVDVGLSPEDLLAGCTRLEVREALRAQTEAAVERGIFGAPTFIVGDELFYGSDRLDFVEAALQSLSAP